MITSSLFADDRRRLVSLVVVLCMAMSACIGVLGPDEIVPSRLDPSLDPDALTDWEIVPLYHPCRGWIGDEPTTPMVLTDVVFVRPGPESPGNQPTGNQIQLLLRRGGQVIYQFHLPIIRAWLPKSNVPALSRESTIVLLARVPDETRYDWRVNVLLEPGTSLDVVAEQFRALGGRLTNEYDAAPAISGIVPDRSIPALTSLSGVRSVSNIGYFPVC